MKKSKPDPENDNDRFPVGDGIVCRRTLTSNFEFDIRKNGCHKRKTLKTKDPRIARRRAEELWYQIRSGEDVEIRKRISLIEGKDKFINSRKVANRSPKTITKYEAELNTFITFASSRGVRFMDQVTPSLVDDYRSWRAKGGRGVPSRRPSGMFIRYIDGWGGWNVHRAFSQNLNLNSL